MKYLYIDTSSSFLYCAIVKDDTLISEVKEDYGQDLSAIALPKISSMFTTNNILPNEINKIIVVNGPGSFTGVRIGITIAKVFAWSLNIPICTIYSLEAMSVSCEDDNIHVPILNARRGYVYAAIYDKDKVELKPQYIKYEELKERLAAYDSYVFISNDDFDWDIECKGYSPNFLKIIEKYKDKKSINPHAVNPEYLKNTEAEEKM